MTSRERLIATMSGQPYDRVPWAPAIDGYFLSSIPKSLHWDAVDVLRYIEADVMERHVPTYRCSIPFGALIYGQGYGKNEIYPVDEKLRSRNVNVKQVRNKDIIFRIYETPIGSLTEKWVAKNSSPWMAFPIEYKIKSLEDIKIYKYILKEAVYRPDYQTFYKEQLRIGDDGIATTSAPCTSVQRLLEFEMGIEAFYHILTDHPSLVEELIELIRERNKEVYHIIARSPAKVVISYENTSTTYISPRIFENYILPEINEYAEILHSADKIFLTHMCGKIKNLAYLLKVGKQDGICDMAPPPTGDLTISQARRIWGSQKILIGGIDATLFLTRSGSQLKSYIKNLLHQIKSGDRTIIGSGDAVPYGTPLENLKMITKIVKDAFS